MTNRLAINAPLASWRLQTVRGLRCATRTSTSGLATLALLMVLAIGSTGCAVTGFDSLAQSPAPGSKAAKAPVPAARADDDPTTASVALGVPAAPLTEPGAPARPPVKIALLLPLTGAGQAAIVAESMKQAAEMALKDVNAAHVQLLVRDDKGTPEGAMAAATEVVGEGAELILGPLYARSVTVVAGIARSKNIPVIAFSNDRQVAGPATHLLSFLAAQEVARVVTYAALKNKRRYIALIPDDAYGKLVEPSFKEAVARAGGIVVAAMTYPVDTGGRSSAVLTIVKNLHDEIVSIEGQGNPIDAIFIPGGEDTVQLLGPLLKQASIDTKRIQVIGTGALDTPNIGRDDAFLGAWFAAPDPRGFKDYSDKFSRAFGHAPPRISSLSYDAATLAAVFATGPDGARFIPTALTRLSGFNGVDGLFRLTNDGITERALSIMEVQKFGAAVIDQAPATFTGSAVQMAAPTAQLEPAAFPSQRGGVSRIN